MNESKSGDSSLRDWFSKSRSSDGTPGWVQLGGKYAGKPCAKQPGQTTKPKCGSSKMKRNLNKDEEQAAFRRKNRQDPNPDRKGKAINVKTEETVIEGKGEKDACYHKVKSRYKVWPSAYASGALVKCRKKGAANWGNSTKKEDYDYSNWRDDFKALEIETIDLIKPDPLLKEGHKSCPKGEYYCYDSKKCKPIPKGYHVMGNGQLMKDEDHEEKNENGNGGDVSEAKKCWKGYEKKGTKKMFGKTYNNCVKKEEVENVDEACWKTHEQRGMKKKGNRMVPNCVPKGSVKKEGYGMCQVDQKVGAVTAIPKDERDAARERILAKAKKRREEREKLKEENAGCKVKKISKEDAIKQQLKKQDEQPLTQNQKEFNIARVHPANEELSNWRSDIEEGAAWTKKSGKSESGGLNEKGRKSYERENPGSDLKAPSKKVGNPRRKSFCARMKGMKKKLTSSKTANDPDSRINKSLRAWNC